MYVVQHGVPARTAVRISSLKSKNKKLPPVLSMFRVEELRLLE